MEVDNNCPLCGQTVGQLAYALAGKAEVCMKHKPATPIAAPQPPIGGN